MTQENDKKCWKSWRLAPQEAVGVSDLLTQHSEWGMTSLAGKLHLLAARATPFEQKLCPKSITLCSPAYYIYTSTTIKAKQKSFF